MKWTIHAYMVCELKYALNTGTDFMFLLGVGFEACSKHSNWFYICKSMFELKLFLGTQSEVTFLNGAWIEVCSFSWKPEGVWKTIDRLAQCGEGTLQHFFPGSEPKDMVRYESKEENTRVAKAFFLSNVFEHFLKFVF